MTARSEPELELSHLSARQQEFLSVVQRVDTLSLQATLLLLLTSYIAYWSMTYTLTPGNMLSIYNDPSMYHKGTHGMTLDLRGVPFNPFSLVLGVAALIFAAFSISLAFAIVVWKVSMHRDLTNTEQHNVHNGLAMAKGLFRTLEDFFRWSSYCFIAFLGALFWQSEFNSIVKQCGRALALANNTAYPDPDHDQYDAGDLIAFGGALGCNGDYTAVAFFGGFLFLLCLGGITYLGRQRFKTSVRELGRLEKDHEARRNLIAEHRAEREVGVQYVTGGTELRTPLNGEVSAA